jgi:uncharacterized flavoprotein (TIGR03862 family)
MFQKSVNEGLNNEVQNEYLGALDKKQHIFIVGGGASALFLACKLDPLKFSVCIYEKNAALARKFLVAGKGGFNLTHSENAKQFVQKYEPIEKLEPIFKAFDNVDFMEWLNSAGIRTSVGSSKRVFPEKQFKPVDVLKTLEKILQKNKVEIKFGVEWKGWDENENLIFSRGNEMLQIRSLHFGNPSTGSKQRLSNPLNDPPIVVFALGGNSWKVTGSNGLWKTYFEEQGISVIPFQASNCAYKVEWDQALINKLEGKALKNVVFGCDGKTRLGEAVITRFGIEGSGVYPLSSAVRGELQKNGTAVLSIDLKPELTSASCLSKLNNKGGLSIKDVLEKEIKLSDTAFQLIKLSTSKEEYQSPAILSERIKNFKITITGLAPIDEAISTVGGIPFEELSLELELIKMPRHYCIGEMINWDAPTGGYLLQMCYSMGSYLASYLNKKF